MGRQRHRGAGRTDAEEIDEAIRAAKNLRMILVETPANPTLIMTDIQRCAEAAKTVSGQKPLVMVDNTMLGPAFQHPLQLGADLVLYSATKYLSGFSDLIGGRGFGERSRADPENPQSARPVRKYSAAGRMLDAG